MRVAYIGNFGPPYSTENHVATAFENQGHELLRWQENDPLLWSMLGDTSMQTGDWRKGLDLILWTRTGWDWAFYDADPNVIEREQHRFLRKAMNHVPVVGFHLDIWWGLQRWKQVLTETFFLSDLVVTADGGHDGHWKDQGINHVWFPPGVSLPETERGTPRDAFTSPIAFVGSWQGHYHQESEHRHELVNWLGANFRRDCAFWPKQGEPAVRGADLRDLYASVQVAVGDSCFVGTGLTRYVSDRIPETLGRGAYLLHPRVEGVTDGQEWQFGPTWQEGEHLGCWEAFDWESLGTQIQWALDNPVDRQLIADEGRDHTRRHHTYERRVDQLIQCLTERSMLSGRV